MSNPQVDESEELSGPEHYPFSEFAYDICARLITTWIGQIIYRRVDYLLSVVEKIARWSVPQEETKKDFCSMPLIRPLPWILFLPALLIMRVIRAALSFAALLLGKQPIYPWTVVSVLQKTHRKLRALKYRGQKLRRISFAERQDEYQPSWLNRAILILRAVIFIKPDGISGVIYKPKQNRHHPNCSKYVAGKRTATQRDEGDSEESMDEATVQQMLDRYADYDGDSTYCEGEASGELSCTSISETEESTVANKNKPEPQKQKPQDLNKNKESSEVKTREEPKESTKQASKPEQNTQEGSPIAKQNGSNSPAKTSSPDKSALNEETQQPKEDKKSVEEVAENETSSAEQQPEQRSMNGSQRSQSDNNLERDSSANRSNSTSRSAPDLGPYDDNGSASRAAKNDSEKNETSETATNGNQHETKSRSSYEAKPAHQHHHKSKNYNSNYQGAANGSGGGSSGGGGPRRQRKSNQNYY